MPTSTSRRRVGRRFSYSTSSPPHNNASSAKYQTSPSRRVHGSKSIADARKLFVDTADSEWSDNDNDSESQWEPYSSTTDARVLTYSSLPPTPLTASPPPPPDSANTASEHEHEPRRSQQEPFSLWDYLREELVANDFDEHQEMKWERVTNFLSIPLAMEKIIGFGFILCLDSFLYTFTIQPIRFLLAIARLLPSLFTRSNSVSRLPPSQKADIIRTLLLLMSLAILVPITDASKIYHSIRGQDTIKLYVIFNALEIADRLLAAIGQDILDCLFSRPALSSSSLSSSKTFRPVTFFALALAYVVSHTLILSYQTISLNVAVNSYDHALLTLLVSNQFVEIKGSVFKKFEKDNLFQICCADIVERFTLLVMLLIVALRNLIELSSWSSSPEDSADPVLLPKSFLLPKRIFGGLSFARVGGAAGVVGTISYPVLTVLISEMLVDWLKHAFITKFNHIRPSVYERFTDVLCGDLKGGWVRGRKHSYVDQSPLVARRLGFAALPLANLAIIIGSQALFLLFPPSASFDGAFPSSSSASSTFPSSTGPGGWMSAEAWTGMGAWFVETMASKELVRMVKWCVLCVVVWVCLVVVKIIIGINLLGYASRRQEGMQRREEEDEGVNNWGRDPIGEGLEEKKYNRELKSYLDDSRDDAAPTAEIGERKPQPDDKTKRSGKEGGRSEKKKLKLDEITRFTMVKRIW